MVKLNEQVVKVIDKLKKKDNKSEKILKDETIKASCQACSCSNDEHEEYIYCGIIDNYICNICCKYELCNDHELVNDILGEKIFKSNKEVWLLCQEYCSN